MFRFVTAILLSCTLLGCGSSSSGSTTLRVDFNGTWVATFNIIVDSCGIVDEDVLSFEDEHTIVQDGSALSLAAAQLIVSEYSGTSRSDSSFDVSGILDGDIFGDGSFCTLSEEVSYEANSQDEATAIYTLKLSCSDGFACSSSARGLASRS